MMMIMVNYNDRGNDDYHNSDDDGDIDIDDNDNGDNDGDSGYVDGNRFDGLTANGNISNLKHLIGET